MKKLFAALAFVVLLGGGCVGGEKTPEVVMGDWYLAFDLPEGWVMMPNYDEGDEALPGKVTSEMEDIALKGSFADVIRVYRLSSRRVVPEEAQDLGNGFFKVSDTEYYFVGTTDKFQFIVSPASSTLTEPTILSAKEVTDFNE